MSAGCIQSVGGVGIVYIAFISFLLILLGVRLRRSLLEGRVGTGGSHSVPQGAPAAVEGLSSEPLEMCCPPWAQL